MKNFLNEIVALRFTPWYRWHPNIALRYLPIIEWMQRKFKVQSSKFKVSVLEVGSGGLGMAPYLKMPVTGVDKEFEPPFHPLLKRVRGDATDLKFPNNSFDVVISVDMLEHLPKDKRGVAVKEMLRVAKKLVAIGVPCGKEAEEHDRKMMNQFQNSFFGSGPGASLLPARRPPPPLVNARSGVRALGGVPARTTRNLESFEIGSMDSLNDWGLRFLKEQVEYGLPEEIDILHYIEAAARDLRKSVKVEIKGNMNLKLREFLMRGWMSKNILVNIVFRKLFLILIPIFRLLDKEPFYRKIFFVTILNQESPGRTARRLLDKNAYRD